MFLVIVAVSGIVHAEVLAFFIDILSRNPGKPRCFAKVSLGLVQQCFQIVQFKILFCLVPEDWRFCVLFILVIGISQNDIRKIFRLDHGMLRKDNSVFQSISELTDITFPR